MEDCAPVTQRLGKGQDGHTASIMATHVAASHQRQMGGTGWDWMGSAMTRWRGDRTDEGLRVWYVTKIGLEAPGMGWERTGWDGWDGMGWDGDETNGGWMDGMVTGMGPGWPEWPMPE